MLDSLYERFGELRSRIAEDGGLRRFVNVYVDGEDIRFLDGLDTPVKDGDEVTILPAVAGGSAGADPLGEFAKANSLKADAPRAHRRWSSAKRPL